MATSYWNDSATDGDLTNAANWTGGVPGAGEYAVIDAGVTDITLNTNFSGTDLAGFRLGPGFRASIGTSGSPLVLKTTTGRAVIAGGRAAARHYIQGAGIAQLIVSRCGDGSTPGTLTLSGTLTTAIHHGDYLEVSGATITTLFQEAAGLVSSSATLVIASGTITTLRRLAGLLGMSGGTVTTLYSEVGGLSLAGGTVTNLECRGFDAPNVWSAGNKTMTSLKVWGGARLNLTGVAQVVTASEVHEGGIIDASQGDVTFTAGPTEYGSGQVLLPSGTAH